VPCPLERIFLPKMLTAVYPEGYLNAVDKCGPQAAIHESQGLQIDGSAPATSSRCIDLVTVERETDCKLLTFRKFACSVGAVVDALSHAGSSLQHTLCSNHTDAAGFELLMSDSNPAIQRTARGLVTACSSISGALVGLAASLTSQVQEPLEELQRAIDADRQARQEILGNLLQQHHRDTEVLESSLRRKDKLTVMRERLEGAKVNSAKKHHSWLRKHEPEGKVQKTEMLHRAAAEEFELVKDQLEAVSRSAQIGSEELCETLGYVDYAFETALRQSLENCACAWENVAHAITASSEMLRSDAKQVNPSLPRSVAPIPRWALQHSGNNIVAQGVPVCGESNHTVITGIVTPIDTELQADEKVAPGIFTLEDSCSPSWSNPFIDENVDAHIYRTRWSNRSDSLPSSNWTPRSMPPEAMGRQTEMYVGQRDRHRVRSVSSLTASDLDEYLVEDPHDIAHQCQQDHSVVQLTKVTGYEPLGIQVEAARDARVLPVQKGTSPIASANSNCETLTNSDSHVEQDTDSHGVSCSK